MRAPRAWVSLLLTLPLVPLIVLGDAEAAQPVLQDAETRVRTKYNEGSTLYSAADYTGAISAFTEALQIVTAELHDMNVRGALLLNLAKAHTNAFDVDHDAEHLRQARSIYTRFIGESRNSDVETETDIKDAQRQIDKIDRQLKKHEEWGAP